LIDGSERWGGAGAAALAAALELGGRSQQHGSVLAILFAIPRARG